MKLSCLVFTAAFGLVACAHSPDASRNAYPPGGSEPDRTDDSMAANDAPSNVDNTNVNERDRNSEAVTPMTQGNSASEVEITAAIRRAVMADSSLGFDAKNVKIITVGTKVTLRGQVSSERERTVIASYATQSRGVSAVDNQVEVKN